METYNSSMIAVSTCLLPHSHEEHFLLNALIAWEHIPLPSLPLSWHGWKQGFSWKRFEPTHRVGLSLSAVISLWQLPGC